MIGMKILMHLVGVRASQSKYVRHLEKVSEVEIDMLLKEYFAGHRIMARCDFQKICGTSFTISRHFYDDAACEGCERGLNL